MRRSELKKRYDNAWLRGYAAALANILRGWKEKSLVELAMIAEGLTVEDFRQAGVEAYDLDEIRAALPRKSAARSRPRPKPGASSVLLARWRDDFTTTELRQLTPECIERVRKLLP